MIEKQVLLLTFYKMLEEFLVDIIQKQVEEKY